MRSKYLFAILFCFLSSKMMAQVSITVPVSGDTVVCNGEPVTLHAVNNGYHSHAVSLSVDDDYSILEPIGFTFKFYGTNYTNMAISSNGFVSFNSSDASGYSDWSISGGIPGNVNCENAVLGAYSDIYIPAGGTVTYGVAGVAPYRKCVINFCNCHMFSCTTLLCSFQIILYETTNIAEVHMKHKDVCSGWNSGAGIEGVQNASATAATVAPGRNFPGTWSVTVPDGRRFTPDATFSTYTCDTIPFAPIPDSSAVIFWYADSPSIVYEGMGTSITVNPSVPTTYEAWAITCSDTSKAFATVTIGTGPSISGFTTTDPTVCGFCDGTITLHGIAPGLSDTVNYQFNGIPQPYVVATALSDSTITLTGQCAGVYSNFTVKQGYCISPVAGPVTLNNPPIAISGETSTPPSVCGACDGTITLQGLYPGASDTINYSYNGTPQPMVIATVAADGTVTLTGLCAGTYDNITATMNVCTSPAVGPVVINNPPFNISDTSSTNAHCAACDGTITLWGLTPGQTIIVNYNYNGAPQPPLTFTSTAGGTITLTNLCEGAYDNMTATLNTCVAGPVGTFNITQPPVVPISFVSSVNPSECGKCDGQIIITGIPPYTIDSVFYTFTPPGGAVTSVGPVLVSADGSGNVALFNLCEGVYNNIYVKVGTCPTSTITSPVTLVAPLMTGAFDTIIHRGCSGDTVYFINESTPPANLHYTWNFGDGTSDTVASPTHIYQQGLYTASLTVTNGYCVDHVTMTLDLQHPLQAAFTANSIVCQATPVTFNNTSTGTPPISYVWNFGDGTTDVTTSPTHTYNNVGAYSVTLIATNFIPCSDTAYETISVDSLSGISLTFSDSVMCTGNAVTFSGIYTSIGNTGDTWNFGNGDSISNINPVTFAYTGPGTYTVTLSAQYRACPTVSISHSISVFSAPIINLGPDTSICPGSDVITLAPTVSGATGPYTYLWNTGQTSPSIIAATPGTYEVTVYSGGCPATDSVVIANGCYMNLPNIFSPNGDGTNDYFYPRQFLTRGVSSFKMDIYNRWGQLVFEATNTDGRGWDGKLNGVDQPEGVYIYNIDATFIDGQREHHQGNLTLLR